MMLSLSEGDRITISATHQVRIDGEDSWVKMEVNAAVRLDETSDAAVARIGSVLAESIVAEIERQAGVILAANAKNAPF